MIGEDLVSGDIILSNRIIDYEPARRYKSANQYHIPLSKSLPDESAERLTGHRDFDVRIQSVPVYRIE